MKATLDILFWVELMACCCCLCCCCAWHVKMNSSGSATGLGGFSQLADINEYELRTGIFCIFHEPSTPISFTCTNAILSQPCGSASDVLPTTFCLMITWCFFLLLSVAVKPKMKVRPMNTTTVEGRSVMLHCIATGEPPPTIQWDRNNKVGAFDLQRFKVSCLPVLHLFLCCCCCCKRLYLLLLLLWLLLLLLLVY